MQVLFLISLLCNGSAAKQSFCVYMKKKLQIALSSDPAESDPDGTIEKIYSDFRAARVFCLCG